MNNVYNVYSWVVLKMAISNKCKLNERTMGRHAHVAVPTVDAAQNVATAASAKHHQHHLIKLQVSS